MHYGRYPIVEKLRKLLPPGMPDAEARETVVSLVTTPNDCLPRLVEYLSNVGHKGDPESLLWAFHGPVCDRMDALYREALGEFIQEILTAESQFNPGQPLPLIFTMDELSRAEAWLTLLERDGRRKKS